MTVTVIGGGPTGVELAGTLADLRTVTLATLFPEIDPARVHIALIDRGPAPLAPFRPALRDYARRQLARRGVDVRFGATIAEITPGKVVLADGTVLPSDITVWAAGVAAPHAVRSWGLPQAAGGRIRTGPDLRVVGQDRIFAVGDIALIDGQPLPQLAQPALQMGRHTADQIRRLEASQPAVPFRYRDKGIMATIGYRSAVVQLPHRVRARGTPAWLTWLALGRAAAAPGRSWRASRSTSSSSGPPAPPGDGVPGTTAGSPTSLRTEGWSRRRQMTSSGPPGSCGPSCPPTLHDCGHHGVAPCSGHRPGRRGQRHHRWLGGGPICRARHRPAGRVRIRCRRNPPHHRRALSGRP